MASLLNGEERVRATLRIPHKRKFDTSVATSASTTLEKLDRVIDAEAISVGEVRGYVEKVKFENENDNLGTLIVRKVLYGLENAITSTVPINEGDVMSDVSNYFELSEQTPTLIYVDTDYEKNVSGGILMQTFPGVSSDVLNQSKLIINQNKLQITQILKPGGMGPTRDLIKYIFSESELVTINPNDIESYPVNFHCRHSKQRLIETLKAYGSQVIDELNLIEEPWLNCQYCGAKIHLTKDDIQFLQK